MPISSRAGVQEQIWKPAIASFTDHWNSYPVRGLIPVCNDFGNKIPYSDYLAAFSQTRIPVKWPNAVPNLEARDDIWPTDRAPVIRRLKTGKTRSPSCAGVFLRPDPRVRLSLISVPRVDGSRWVGVWYRHHIFSSLPERNRQRPSGNSPRSARTGSASPVYGIPWHRVVTCSRC